MNRTLPSRKPKPKVQEAYSAFQQINGSHPLRSRVPESVLEYPVQELPFGRVTYFNFRLAKEMGLVEKNHPHKLNRALEAILLKTFALRIYNEFDQQNQTKPLGPFKENTYMATRYLQLQHKSKSGRTSGDGRSIWNGVYRNGGRVWDVSSRGTGVTCLSPGAAEANKNLATGSTEFGYGCGLAETDELLSSTIMSEILHSQGLRTERMLCFIDLGKGLGIGVRAAENLLRPAHLFLHLKQARHKAVQRSCQYLVERQVKNGHWPPEAAQPRIFLKQIAQEFAQFAAQLEFHCIFLWMDWDGDNLLAHAGIIDYGSIRQFGLRHEHYRYDDVQRFSTSLSEQKKKARQTVQTFAQLADFWQTGRKRPLEDFKNSPALKIFDSTFENTLQTEFLKLWGVKDSRGLKPQIVRSALRALIKIEKIHSSFKLKKLPDGVNRPALYSRRKLLSSWSAAQFASSPLSPEELHRVSLADTSWGKDRRLTSSRHQLFKRFDESMSKLLSHLDSKGIPPDDLLQNLQNIQEKPLATGNAVEEMVGILLRPKREHIHLQSLVDSIVAHFAGPHLKKFGPEQCLPPGTTEDFAECLERAEELKEDI